jgi:hypothetical protein
LFSSRRRDRHVLYGWSLLTRLAGCTTLYLVKPDLEEARETLIARGVTVGAIRHKDPVDTWAGGWSAGLDPKRRDYASFADFADPDGNTWTLQERGHRTS